MLPTEYRPLLRMLSRHNARLGADKRLKGIVYERCLELPLLVSRMQSLFDRPLTYLDIGSGDSPFPSFLLASTAWHITVVDKHDWIQRQQKFARKVPPGVQWQDRFTVREQDFLQWVPSGEGFDVITCISVIEHFEGETDTEGMRKAASLLKPGGLLFLTVPFNEGYAREFYVKSDVYGEEFSGTPVFFQRHYDTDSLKSRLLQPSGLEERERLFFGDYGFQAKELLTNISWPWKPLKGLYQWATPLMAQRWGSYADGPVSRPDMAMYTASGVFLVLERI